jgi:hypothetical protein
MIALTMQKKEKLVLELYSQGKTYRQIAEEARICSRDIKIILDNVVKERESEESLSVSSQALHDCKNRVLAEAGAPERSICTGSAANNFIKKSLIWFSLYY